MKNPFKKKETEKEQTDSNQNLEQAKTILESYASNTGAVNSSKKNKKAKDYYEKKRKARKQARKSRKINRQYNKRNK